jgi:hypothetical protein
MLDECKGDKFFEILATFSSAVLKKVLASQEGTDRDDAVAQKLATASMLSVDEQRSLLPLAIAHKAALASVLKRKEQKRRRYMKFQELLDTKAKDINRRIRKCQDAPRPERPAIPQKEADAIKKQLKDNWIGDPKWLDVILYGDNVQAGDAFLHSRFDKVWRMVECGRKLEDVTPEIGLLENLQLRVQEQQKRLQNWKAFHAELKTEKLDLKPHALKVPVVKKDFKFEEHLQYQLPTAKSKETDSKTIQHPVLRLDYQTLLDDMKSELLRVSKSKSIEPIAPMSRRRTSSSTVARSPARSRKNTRSEALVCEAATSPKRTTRSQAATKKSSLDEIPVLPRPRHVPIASTPTDSDATLVGLSSTMRSTVTVANQIQGSQQDNQHNAEIDIKSTASTSPPEAPASVSPAVNDLSDAEKQSPSFNSTPPCFTEPHTLLSEPLEFNTEELLAEEIVNAIGNATPSPVKKPQPRMSMSLMERTRMTMARTTSFDPMPESPLPLPSPQLPEPPTAQPETHRRATLLERTRLSMVAMQSKPRVSLGPKERRKSRHSLFPVNQFDTPRNRKSFELVEEENSAEKTPKEVLFSDKVDYDRVFKSRPKIATSPVFSPPQNSDDDEMGWDEGVTGIDLDDVDRDEDEDGFTGMVEGSPSRRTGKVQR